VTGTGWQFGPFVADRLGYRVVRGGAVVELTPKLLDLLFHLVDRPGVLVTKEELLDALWPDANVTDNALTQAVSELRQALGDDAGDPQFIKTVARRGYRFIAQVAPIDAAPPSLSPAFRDTLSPAATSDAIAVLDFNNVTGDADSAWLSAGIAETVTSDLRGLGRFRVVDRERVAEAERRSNGSFQRAAAELEAPLVVVGSFQQQGDRIRITARIVNVQTGEAEADAKVDGPIAEIFELQDRIVTQFSKELGMAATIVARRATSPKAGFSSRRSIRGRSPVRLRASSAPSSSIRDMRSPTPDSPARSSRRTKKRGQTTLRRATSSTPPSGTRAGRSRSTSRWPTRAPRWHWSWSADG
jgi:DNA-binding winged helix-turn-helix (wHTH) protein